MGKSGDRRHGYEEGHEHAIRQVRRAPGFLEPAFLGCAAQIGRVAFAPGLIAPVRGCFVAEQVLIFLLLSKHTMTP